MARTVRLGRLGRCRSTSTAALLSCALAALGVPEEEVEATEFFFDDFEGYFDDSDLTDLGGWEIVEVNGPEEAGAAWTVSNPCGRTNPPGADGTPTTGNFVISDSDCSGGVDGAGTGRSHDLISPVIETEGSESIWIHFACSAQLNNNGTVVFDVDVSTDGGATWENIFRRVAPSRITPPLPTAENVDGYYGELHLDASEAAAGAEEIRLRFRQFEPDDDWWIAVDDVLVDDVAPPDRGAVTLVGPETFALGIPETWTVLSVIDPPNTGAETWTTEDPCRRSVVRFNGDAFPYLDGRSVGRHDEHFAILDSDCDPDPPEDEWLILPTLDCTDATEVFLEYDDEIDATGDVQEVLVSFDGGATFELGSPLFSYTLGGLLDPGEDPFFARRRVPVPEAAGRPEVTFAFHYQGAGNQWWWAVDDVKVTANGEGLPTNTCANREFTVLGFDTLDRSISMTWRPAPGDEGFRIVANGAQVGLDLPADATSFRDPSPPAGDDVTYALQALAGGEVRLECAAPPITGFSCPSGLSCCYDPDAGDVTLSWSPGSNIDAGGWRITRDGVPIRTVPLDSSSFVDRTVPGAGTFTYELQLNGGDPSQCPDLPLRCDVTVAGVDVVLFDDFDCYSDDDDVRAAGWRIVDENDPVENATWTVTNPGARANPPTEDGTPSTGRFLVSDSDAAGGANPTGSGMSHDIWSPSFDASALDEVWLHLDASFVLNNNGKCVVDIDVTTDDGASWENVFRRVAAARAEAAPFPRTEIPEDFERGPQDGNSDGVFGRLHLDLSAVAAGEADVRFRVRHFEPEDDWWVAIDDVRVDDHPMRGGETPLLEARFDDGLPAGWTSDSLGDAFSPWVTEDLCSISHLLTAGGVFPDGADGRQLHWLGDSFAVVASCLGELGQDELLLTPTLDLSEAEDVRLEFRSASLITAAPTASVLLSVDDGDTFLERPVFSYHAGGSWHRDAGNAEVAFNEYVFDLPEAAGERRVVLGFRFENPSGENSWWAIDGVRVSTTEEPAATGFVRGDADGSGEINITDGIFVLNFLFLGGSAPPCRDAADADDSDETNITDGIFILNFLFLGGVAPPPPHPGCGPDPSGEDDGLDCATPPEDCAAA